MKRSTSGCSGLARRCASTSRDSNRPASSELASRLPAVLEILYLLFTEGYSSAQPDRLIRHELCEEAIRLGLLLDEHPVGAVPETAALLALMYLNAARFDSRVDGAGGLLILEEQDRSLWDRELIHDRRLLPASRGARRVSSRGITPKRRSPPSTVWHRPTRRRDGRRSRVSIRCSMASRRRPSIR